MEAVELPSFLTTHASGISFGIRKSMYTAFQRTNKKKALFRKEATGLGK